jgi:hypothetical protein
MKSGQGPKTWMRLPAKTRLRWVDEQANCQLSKKRCRWTWTPYLTIGWGHRCTRRCNASIHFARTSHNSKEELAKLREIPVLKTNKKIYTHRAMSPKNLSFVKTESWPLRSKNCHFFRFSKEVFLEPNVIWGTCQWGISWILSKIVGVQSRRVQTLECSSTREEPPPHHHPPILHTTHGPRLYRVNIRISNAMSQ